ncbi:ThiF family adenylyltransferase [Marinobacter sp.]|uniref:ThiF family adenylyltransferase n=1 Tax=Marinobacter sp. TaxID=50741 RepID=UPI0023531CBD|nr:ThiF family adenylyltransferase [Marinobacter sp.]
MDGWWDRYPELFEAEISALETSGWVWSKRAGEQRRGCLVIDFVIERDNERLKLIATFPDSYPYFPPEVALSSKQFKRHQNAWSMNLCLLAREGEDWQPGVDTLASLVRDQLPEIFESNDSATKTDRVANIEDHVGEAFSSFLPCHPESAIIVPDETPSADIACGLLKLNIRPLPQDINARPLINGAVRFIQDMGSRPVATLNAPPGIFVRTIGGFWMRLPGPPQPANGGDQDKFKKRMLEKIKTEIPEVRNALKKAKPGEILVFGFVYQDELRWREKSDDWFFLAMQVVRQARRSQPMHYQLELVKPDWGGERAWMQRAPHLASLRERKAVVVGVGSLGAPLAINLAKAGIKELTVIDRDYLQVGNTIRWPLGWQYAGLRKVKAIHHYLQSNHPYTKVKPLYLNIGVPHMTAEESDLTILRRSVESSDIIVDASANFRLSHFLSDLAAELGKPYIWLTTTHGAAGGTVGRVVPGKTKGCWHCFQHALGDGTLPLPADSGGEDVQPGGCAQSTFIGAALDSDEVALLASRLTVATLSLQGRGGYPDFEWDVAVGDFWDGERKVSLSPHWATGILDAHERCPRCNS